MTCASCVSHVEKALNEVPGVTQTVVNLATGRAAVQLDDSSARIERLVEAVQRIGYEVPVETAALTVTGMTCASCVAHVEHAMRELVGVMDVAVTLDPGSARVTYIPGVVTLAR
jgi:Cu+-exporting ATPase